MKIRSVTLTLLFTLLSLSLIAQEVKDDPTKVSPVLIGSTIPDVSVKTVTGENASLRDLVATKPTVLIFYRGGWCPYCNRHMAEINNIEKDLEAEGYQLLAISPDRPEKLQESISKNELGYTLLSDSPANAIKAFGLAFRVDDATVARYLRNGIDLEKDAGFDHHILPVPAVFVIDQAGIIKFSYVNPDYKTRINSELLITAARVYK